MIDLSGELTRMADYTFSEITMKLSRINRGTDIWIKPAGAEISRSEKKSILKEWFVDDVLFLITFQHWYAAIVGENI